MIGAVLLNALWQGAFIVIVGFALTAIVPRRNASTRYAVWFVAMLSLAIVPLVTLWQSTPLSSLPTSVIHATTAASRVTRQAAYAGGWYLTVAWLGGVALGLIRLVLSYVRITKIVCRAEPAPHLGAGIVTSDEVAVPISAGVIGPVVVLPKAIESTFDRDDIECILRHERAHITRLDVAGNFIQRVIEAFFFFTPWVHLIGRQLIKEREAACDDWVVHGVAAPERYARCLARLAQDANYRSQPLLTPSAIGPKNILVARVARLLDGKDAQVKTNYFVVGAGIVAFVLLAFVLQLRSESAIAATTNPNFPANCYHDITVTNAVAPNIPKSEYRPNVTSNAVVTVDAQGRPVSAKIVQSSGSEAIDHATIDAAMHSSYSPEVSNCKPKTGQYLFHVETGAPAR